APSAAFVDDLVSVAALVFLVGAVVFFRLLHIRRKAAGSTDRRGWRRELAALLVFVLLVALVVGIVRRRAEVSSPAPPSLSALPKAPPHRAQKPSPVVKDYRPSFRW